LATPKSRFEISMDDPLAVGEGQPSQHLTGDVERPSGRQWPPGEQVREGLPEQQLHHQVGRARGHPGVGHRDDVRVGEHRQGLGLALEALARLRLSRRALLEDLDGDVASELPVVAPVDHAHPTSPDARLNLVPSL
jgi:hypothetical protein